MINESTLNTLKAMHCSAMAEELSRQMQDPSTYSQLGFEERIGLIIDAEWNRRQKTKLTKLITKARFSLASACVEGIEYLPDRKLDKAQILRFATCQYINENHHIILKGASGSGKTYLGIAHTIETKMNGTNNLLNLFRINIV